MRCRLGGANESDLGHSRGDQGRPDRIAFRAQALAFLRDDRGSGKGEITWLTMHAVSSTSRARETMGDGIGRNAFAGGSSGGGQIWPGWNRPGNIAAIGADLA